MPVTSIYYFFAVTPDTSVVAMTTPNIMTNDSSAVIASATIGINVMTSSSTGLMATTPPTDVTRQQNDDSGSSVGGIVAGCVVAFIVFVAVVVCLIVFLIWYRAKKKGEYTTKPGMTTYILICVLLTYFHYIHYHR